MSETASGRRVLVVGAGVIGTACATWLQRKGFAVTVVDERAPGEGCSFGNAGNVSPGSVVPYSVPGSLARVPGWLLDPLGPLAIRWRHLPKMLPWLMGWIAASRTERALEISRAMRTLHAATFDEYAWMLRAAGGDGLVARTGQLYVSERPGGALGTQLAAFMREAAGVRVEALGPDEIRQIEPALARSYQSGLLLPDNGNCTNPHRLVQVLAEQVIRQGGTILRERVTGFEMGPEGPRAAITAGGSHGFDRLVIAAGAWSNRLTEQLGARVPLVAERGYHVTLGDAGVTTRMPITNRDFSFATAPMEMGLRLAGTAEYADVDAPPNWRRARVLLRHGAHMFPGLRTATFTEWMGARPALPDGLPVLCRSPRHANVVFAFGNAHFGLTAAPTMGRLVSEMVAGETPSIDLRPFSVARFGRGSGRRADVSAAPA